MILNMAGCYRAMMNSIHENNGEHMASTIKNSDFNLHKVLGDVLCHTPFPMAARTMDVQRLFFILSANGHQRPERTRDWVNSNL
jgi:hypothetical protein